MAIRPAARKLLAWYRRHQRDLPWRRTRNPYRIWISEVMLQQTQVATVIPYYRRFLERFPDVEALARAREQDVLAVWSGLGYYRRARHLHAAARVLLREHQGRIPRDLAALRRLPGIGRYTAGALASIAFDRPEPAIDGNAERVLSRFLARRDHELLEEVVRNMMLAASPSQITQALMELGALVCAPTAPACGRCPLEESCRARQQGLQSEFPAAKRRRPSKKLDAAVAVVRQGSALLMLRRDGEELLRGMWEFPGDFLEPGEEPEAGLRRVGRDRIGRAIVTRKLIASVEQTLTYRRVRVHAFDAVLAEPTPAGWKLPRGARWVSMRTVGRLPHGSRTAKLLSLLATLPREKKAGKTGGGRA
ncbi:MAG TPA: A/G-specific adenine glycosylase [Candidatus Polarisedimenticolia bacterium]|nr:A/G-specific adenine glycosylase [Candidatus Polarisedimenticolia bacterium]